MEEIMKRRIFSILALVLVLALALTGCSGAKKLNMATGGATGTYYAFGSIVAKVFNEKLDDVQITVASTGASKANIQMIADGDADIALVQNDVMDYAYNGTDLFSDKGAITGFSAMAAAYAEVCQVVASPSISSIADLKGKRVSVGDAGSGTEFNARQILGAYGITFDDITVSNLGFGESAESYKDGKIDAFFCVAGSPTTAIMELATSNDVNILAIDDAHALKLMEDYPFYTQYSIPGGSYKGIDSDVMTVAVKATFVVSNKLSEDLVYNMTKALFENKDSIASGHDKGKELDSAYAVSGISVPFHPGAEKYFKEIGVL